MNNQALYTEVLNTQITQIKSVNNLQLGVNH